MLRGPSLLASVAALTFATTLGQAAATDFGVFTSSDDGVSWSRYGTGLPNVVVDQLTPDPNGNLVATAHGRGVWTIAAP